MFMFWCLITFIWYVKSCVIIFCQESQYIDVFINSVLRGVGHSPNWPKLASK